MNNVPQKPIRYLAIALVIVLATIGETSADDLAPHSTAMPTAPSVTLPGEPARLEPLPAEPLPAEPTTTDHSVAVSPTEPSAVQRAVGFEATAVGAQETPDSKGGALSLPGGIAVPQELTSPEGLGSTIQMLLMLAVVSLAPAVLMMTTCFVRIVVVLGLLRQSLGGQQMAPNQVITALALFMSLVVMSPVWTKVYHDAIEPYTSHEITLDEAWQLGIKPVRNFMSAQIERTGNSDDVWLFYKYLPQGTQSPTSYDDVPLQVLLPAFVLSELKTAFLIGFQIFLPFVVVDLVVASMTVSMGMMMVPPSMISMPLKLLLFVLVDGWRLVVGMLLDSFQIVAG